MICVFFSIDDSKKEVALTIEGHSGLAEHGQDLVCASASILTYTLAKNIVDLMEVGGYHLEADIELESGNSHIITTSKDEDTFNEVSKIFLTIWSGYLLLSSSYPDNIRLNMA